MNSSEHRRVFIVYGRNEGAYDAMVLFLRAAGLEPFSFNQVKNELGGAQFIGDIVSKGISRAQATILLFTPDERAGLRQDLLGNKDDEKEKMRWQPRPNVLVESGMALAYDAKRTLLVVLGDVSMPSDLHGRNLLSLNNSSKARSELREALIGAGCQVKGSFAELLNPTVAGDFEACVSTPSSPETESPPEESPKTKEQEGPLFCIEDIRIRKDTPTFGERISDEDVSDLNYLLLNVVDCKASRDIIRGVYKKWAFKLSDQGTETEPPKIRLTGMYDIMGKWDLLVRFRLHTELRADNLVKQIGQELIGKDQILYGKKSPERIRKAKMTVQNGLINVKYELPSPGGHNSARDEIHHVRLGSTADYDRARCQRAFLYIDLPTNEAETLISELERCLRLEKEPASIVEAISIGDKAIILEIFMRCSQTHLINGLNRLVEEFIPAFRVQKYTLFCYEYDEKEIAF